MVSLRYVSFRFVFIFPRCSSMICVAVRCVHRSIYVCLVAVFSFFFFFSFLSSFLASLRFFYFFGSFFVDFFFSLFLFLFSFWFIWPENHLIWLFVTKKNSLYALYVCVLVVWCGGSFYQKGLIFCCFSQFFFFCSRSAHLMKS